jgi:hypothetical protein
MPAAPVARAERNASNECNENEAAASVSDAFVHGFRSWIEPRYGMLQVRAEGTPTSLPATL